MYCKRLQHTLKLATGVEQLAYTVALQPCNLEKLKNSRTLYVARNRTHVQHSCLGLENSEQNHSFSIISSFARARTSCFKQNSYFSTSSEVSSSILIRNEISKLKHISLKTTVSFIPLSSDSIAGETVAIQRGYVSRKTYLFCEIKEEDLEEDFVRGSGPGGQSVNQTANCVVLKHKPSGIVVKCHETRSLQVNRQRARERLKEKLDFHLHGCNSFLALQEQELSQRRKEMKKRNKSRLEKKKAFKEREGLE